MPLGLGLGLEFQFGGALTPAQTLQIEILARDGSTILARDGSTIIAR